MIKFTGSIFLLFAMNSLLFPASFNFFISDIQRSVALNQINIEKIDNFKIITQPDGILENIDVNENSSIIIDINNEFEFNELIPSLSIESNDGDIFSIFIIAEGEEYCLGNFSTGNSRSFSIKREKGEVNVDVVRFYKKIKRFKLKINVYNNSRKKIRIKLINIVLTDRELKLTDVKSIKKIPVKLQVPMISQMEQQLEYNEDICSPTSLAMVLEYYKVHSDISQLASSVIDLSEEIYGNWVFNTLYASTKGVYAFVVRLNSYEELYMYLIRKIPVIASITFKSGKLKNSPLKKTKGHLLVIKGINKNGDIIVNDPAAISNEKVEITYNAKEFAKAWFENKYGTAYIVVDDIFRLISPDIPYASIFSKSNELQIQLMPDELTLFIKKDKDFVYISSKEKLYNRNNKLNYYDGYIKNYTFSLPQIYNGIVKEKSIDVYDPYGNKISTFSMGTKVLILNEDERFYLVSVLNHLFYVSKKGIWCGKKNEKENLRERVIELAEKFIGTGYKPGGRSFDGIDLQGLISVVYKVCAIDLPLNLKDQFISSCKIKNGSKLKKGDLIFLASTGGYLYDVMLYMGGEKVIGSTEDFRFLRKISFRERFNRDVKKIYYGSIINGRKIYLGSFIDKKR